MINKKLVEVENVSLDELVATITKSVLDGLEIRLAKLNEQKEQETLMTRTETAKYLKVNSTTLWHWTKKGKLKALLIAPLCVDLAYRNQGIGSKLMNYGLMKAKELGYDTAFLVGNPEYYQKFGFLCVTNYNLKNMTTVLDKYVMVK